MTTMAAGAIPPLVLVSGDEPLLVERAVSHTVAALRRREPELERREAAVAELDPQRFSDLVAPSLFAEPRVVIVLNVHEAAKELADALLAYIADPVDGVTLIVGHSGAAKNKAVADAIRRNDGAVFTALKLKNQADRVEFVRAEIKRVGGTCSGPAAAAIVDAVGSDLRELAAAAGQLAADTGGMVDETAVARYYRGRAEVSGFTIADHAVAGNTVQALESLRWAQSIGVPPVLIADALADGLRTIAKVAGARSANSYALAGELGMPAWKIDKARQVVRRWQPESLARAVGIAAALNADVKGVAADPDFAVERAVLGVARAARGG